MDVEKKNQSINQSFGGRKLKKGKRRQKKVEGLWVAACHVERIRFRQYQVISDVTYVRRMYHEFQYLAELIELSKRRSKTLCVSE